MDIRIGVTQSPREIALEVEDDAAGRKKIKAAVEAAMSGATDVLWLTDKKGREIAVPGNKIAYVEFGSPDSDKKMGFGG
jgi:hypothetical protein